MVVDVAMRVIHLVTAAGWVGSILFVAGLVLPGVRDDRLPESTTDLLGPLTMSSRIAAVVMFLTGGHLAATNYTSETLFATGRGHLVLTMLGLWFALAGLVEVANAKITDDAGSQAGLYAMQAAAVVGVVLLVVGGLLG